jgi:hypothetical protein
MLAQTCAGNLTLSSRYLGLSFLSTSSRYGPATSRGKEAAPGDLRVYNPAVLRTRR